MTLRRTLPWLLWLALSLTAAGMVWHAVQTKDTAFLSPGPLSSGHYQIELACQACHTPNKGVLQEACQACHQKGLDEAHDSHPDSKFLDPRNAEVLEKFNALQCTTCHNEHVPERTSAMGVTQPLDYCSVCHNAIGQERPSHAKFTPMSCAKTGCHNYHDNRLLYADYIEGHLDEPATLAPKQRKKLQRVRQAASAKSLSASQHDAGPKVKVSAKVLREWEASDHARAGINCRQCHTGKPEDTTLTPASPNWQTQVDYSVCHTCHTAEAEGFLAGRHGMRLGQRLSPLTPGSARLPMHPAAAGRELTCMSCHKQHKFEPDYVQVNACLECHADKHSLAYKNSPHYMLWLQESLGKAAEGTGVSCASCHLPRYTEHGESEHATTHVEHNQNRHFRPLEKMAQQVCLNCHGLEFSLNSLADPRSLHSNFALPPSKKLQSFDMIRGR